MLIEKAEIMIERWRVFKKRCMTATDRSQTSITQCNVTEEMQGRCKELQKHAKLSESENSSNYKTAEKVTRRLQTSM